MSEEISSLTATSGVEGTSSPAEVVDNGSQASGQEPAVKSAKPSYDPNWWKNDDRFTKRKLWKAEPDIVKSYFELEPQYNKVKGEYTTLQKQNAEIVEAFEEFGIEPTKEQIKTVFTELNSFKDPMNPVVARSNYISRWLDHQNPKYRNDFTRAMQDLENREMQENFPGWTEQQIAEHKKMQAELEALRVEREKAKLEKDTQVSTERMNQGLSQAKAYAEKTGFQFTGQVKNSLIDYCIKNQIPTSFVFETFLRLNGEGIEKALIEKANQGQLKNLNKNQKSVILAAGSAKPKAKEAKPSFRESMMRVLGGS